MSGPLSHMPLALCDPNSISPSDIIPTSLVGLTPTGAASRQLSLRHNELQEWFFYPSMSCDEIILFKQFRYFKNSENTYSSCFHTAFKDPKTTKNA